MKVEQTATKKCRVCFQVKPNAEMKARGKSKRTGEKLAGSICKVCDNIRIREARKANMTPERRAAIRRREKNGCSKRRTEKVWQKYGITREEVELQTIKQGGKCLICGDMDKKLVVDHCHTSGKFRGLICGQCNSMLGMARDNPEILHRGIQYLTNGDEMPMGGGVLISYNKEGLFTPTI